MMSTHPSRRPENFHNYSNWSPKLCVICRCSNLKQPSPDPDKTNSSDPDKDSDQLLRIFYQCINVQPPIKYDKPNPPQFCTSCKEYLEEWDNIAMQVALLITRAKRIENTLTSRVLIASKSAAETRPTDDEFFRGHLRKRFNPVVQLEKIQQEEPSDEVVSMEPENAEPLTSEAPRISSGQDSDQETESTRRSKRLKKRQKNLLKNSTNGKPDLKKDGYPNFSSKSIEKVGPGEYKYDNRIPFTFKDGVFSCGCCFKNYEGPLGHAKSKMFTHVTKFHSDDLPDWLDRAGLDASQIKFLQLGSYIFRQVVPFSVRRNPTVGRHVSLKCELCPRATSGPLKQCWSEFSRHMTLTHMGDGLGGSPEANEDSSDQDCEEERSSRAHYNNYEMEKVVKEEPENDGDDLFVPEVNVEEFGQGSQRFENLNQITSSDLSSILATGQDGFLCQLCSVLFLNQPDLNAHIDLVHSDLFKSELEPGFEPMITQEDLFNEGENIDDDYMKFDPLEIGP